MTENCLMLIRKFGSFCLLIPFLLMLGTVFIVSNDLANSTVSGKYFWFYGCMGLIGLLTLVRTLTHRHSFRFSVMDLLVLLFAAAVYISACLLNDTALNTTKLTILTLLVVLYFSLRLSKGLQIMPVITVALILTGLVEAIWGLRQLYGFDTSQHSLFKLTGSFFNPGPYAGYLAVVFPMALYLSKNVLAKDSLRDKGAGKLFLGGLGVFTCIAILLVLPAAMSRASWLAVLAGSAVVIRFHYSEHIRKFYLQHKKHIRIIGGTVALFLLIAATGMYYLKKNSADGRALTWKISLQTIAKHPFGVGLGNFSGAYGETQAAYFASGQATETEQLVAGNPEYGFNEYLQIAVESGIVALLLFVGIIVLAVRNMIKAKNWGVLGSIVALLVFAAFSYPFSVLPFLIVFVVLHADDADLTDLHRCSLSKSHLKICVNLSNPSHLRATILALSCLLVTVSCLYKQYSVYRAYKQWKTDQLYYHVGLYKDTAENYESLYPYLNDQIRFLFEYAQCLSKSDQPEKSNAILQRAMQISCDPMLYNIMGKNYQAMKRYEEAETILVKSTQLVPSRLYPWYLLTKLYDEMGLKDKVRETADIVCSKEPKVQSQAVKEMREEVRKLKVKN
ncbi:MAG: O-antigen ligase family protein [Dysgonamonadaceae bacterium]|jgi:O-antigen ligase|nr:O-antigen ligase family protein [Dysgonamonadaceae bacterium]